jgi:hypothetical protein
VIFKAIDEHLECRDQRQFARMSGVGGKADLALERPDFSL